MNVVEAIAWNSHHIHWINVVIHILDQLCTHSKSLSHTQITVLHVCWINSFTHILFNKITAANLIQQIHTDTHTSSIYIDSHTDRSMTADQAVHVCIYTLPEQLI